MATISVTQYSDANPSPRVEVLLTGLPAGTVTVRRISDGRTYDVRGGIHRTSTSSVSVLDTEVPEGIVAAYQAEMFDTSGVSLGFTSTVLTTMPVTGIWVSQPLDPSIAVKCEMTDDSAAEISRPFEGEVVYTDGSALGRWIGGRRRGLVGLELRLETSSVDDADELQEVFGTYGTDQLPVVCIRTPPGFARIPRTLFLTIPDGPTEIDVNTRFGGSLVSFVLKGDEVLPPAPGLVKALLRYQDTDLFYGTYSALAAAYGTYSAWGRDYSKAGYAG